MKLKKFDIANREEVQTHLTVIISTERAAEGVDFQSWRRVSNNILAR